MSDPMRRNLPPEPDEPHGCFIWFLVAIAGVFMVGLGWAFR